MIPSRLMPIRIEENAALRIHLITFSGKVIAAELRQLAALHEERRDWAAMDTVHRILAEADFSAVALSDLDWLRQHYRLLHQSMNLHLLRRAIWLCENPVVMDLVAYWTQGRHTRDGQQTEVRAASSFAEFDDLFDGDEVDAVQTGSGFVAVREIALKA